MNFVTITPAFRVCLISITCMALIVGCGNEGRESARSQLAQRTMTNSPAAAKITPGETARAEETEEKAREQLARLNLKFPDDFMRCIQNNDTLAVRLFLEARINTEQQDKVDGWT